VYKKAGKSCMNSFQKNGTLFETKNGIVPGLIAIGVHQTTLISLLRYEPFVNSFIKKHCKF
jgi:hypothetical protein